MERRNTRARRWHVVHRDGSASGTSQCHHDSGIIGPIVRALATADPVLSPALFINPELAPSERRRWQRNGARSAPPRGKNPQRLTMPKTKIPIRHRQPGGRRIKQGRSLLEQGPDATARVGMGEAGVAALGCEWRKPGMGSPELGLVFSCYGREGIKARRGVPPGSGISTKLGMTHTCTFVGQRSMFGVIGDTLLRWIPC